MGYFPSKAADGAGPTFTEKDPAAVSSPSAAEAEKETLKFSYDANSKINIMNKISFMI